MQSRKKERERELARVEVLLNPTRQVFALSEDVRKNKFETQNKDKVEKFGMKSFGPKREERVDTWS